MQILDQPFHNKLVNSLTLTAQLGYNELKSNPTLRYLSLNIIELEYKFELEWIVKYLSLKLNKLIELLSNLNSSSLFKILLSSTLNNRILVKI